MFTDAAASAPQITMPPAASPATGPRTPAGKAVAARNATTHGLFARDVVLPALGEDPQGYRLLEDAWLAQLPPRTLLEQHYVEKIAAASWRLRRLHRWQAQLFEDDALTEDARLDRLDKALRHETHLHRQIDTAVKMLGKDAPALYARRVRDEVLEEARTSERECREDAREETDIDLETRGRLRRIRKATEAVVAALADAPLDTRAGSGPVPPRPAVPSLSATPWRSAEPVVPAPVLPAPPTDAAEKCRNELPFEAAEAPGGIAEPTEDRRRAAHPHATAPIPSSPSLDRAGSRLVAGRGHGPRR